MAGESGPKLHETRIEQRHGPTTRSEAIPRVRESVQLYASASASAPTVEARTPLLEKIMARVPTRADRSALLKKHWYSLVSVAALATMAIFAGPLYALFAGAYLYGAHYTKFPPLYKGAVIASALALTFLPSFLTMAAVGFLTWYMWHVHKKFNGAQAPTH